jgi:hypothetical protein
MLVSAVRASGLDVALLVGQATLLGGPSRQPKARDDVTAPMPVVPERKALHDIPGGRVP